MTSPLEERIKSGLEHSAQQLDAETQQQLQAIRHEALTQPKRKSWLSIFQANYWLPTTGFVLASFIAAMLFLPQLQPTEDSITLEQTAMLELLDNPEDLEVISDPDFYLWVEELSVDELEA